MSKMFAAFPAEGGWATPFFRFFCFLRLMSLDSCPRLARFDPVETFLRPQEERSSGDGGGGHETGIEHVRRQDFIGPGRLEDRRHPFPAEAIDVSIRVEQGRGEVPAETFSPDLLAGGGSRQVRTPLSLTMKNRSSTSTGDGVCGTMLAVFQTTFVSVTSPRPSTRTASNSVLPNPVII